MEAMPVLARIPKAELHVHFEGTITPDLRRTCAQRNGLEADLDRFPLCGIGPVAGNGIVTPGTPPAEALRAFLSVYDASIATIRTERDVYEIVMEHGRSRLADNVVYSEVFFDPQAHVDRGVSFDELLSGLTAGVADSNARYGLETALIMCFHRDRPADEALEMLRLARRWREHIIGVGLDDNEIDGWTSAFRPVFDAARSEGYHLTSHCDCDLPNATADIRRCLDILRVERIDHGIDVLYDEDLVADSIERNICFTVCPTWRHGETAPRRLSALRTMLDRGLLVTVNSDDPGLFASGTLGPLMSRLIESELFDSSDYYRLARNSFIASWLADDAKERYLKAVDAYALETRTG